MSKKPITTVKVNDLIRKIGQKVTRGFVIIKGSEVDVKGYTVRKNGSGCDIYKGRTSYGGGVSITGVKTRRIK
ncbi:MAG: hypothetical protein KAI71_04400 [Candidatus Pacebacteria bacterium]|nr:hypothetical protein [Candidatus Paceibacterota bacterium]